MPLPYAQLESPAWRSLAGAAVKLWLELHTRFNGSTNGRVTLSYSTFRDRCSRGSGPINLSMPKFALRDEADVSRRADTSTFSETS